MSKRNSQEAKRAARERLRAERERQAKKDKARRQALVGVAVLGVLAVAGGIFLAVTKLTAPSGWEAAKEQKLVKPANSSGKDGEYILVGNESAKKSVDVYEDLRCPACAQFEQGAGKLLVKGAEDGKYKLRVHLGDLIDGNLGGEGSKNAISALGAALNVSKDAYRDYHEKLYSPQFHPQETQDKFAEDDYLIKVADTVPALKKDAGFKKAVEDGKYDRWALDMVADFKKSKVNGTPTIRIDGKDVDQQQLPGELEKLGVKIPGGGQPQKQ
ncbi:disulfide bond formation protein DsbA [Streptomyces abyssalis]|uniref:Disulfide bond formation protein DsbA n=1 Tax=Streptomyces abyssalis TaxID=933944 RepID=A0A1E7JL24_9ACTN|nr:thioredoxin domain-containing protein [Streptomyces abyssalis]OEU88343.1 disulfide bond formation protein DsbA [Streptomyces abyssalis]OEU91213.1 disulfide bond formation protein DsbA [Streptomyces abyssalis]OEV08800.1 disulfide bond formation protein DsbA [Streptomyces nanshensis]